MKEALLLVFANKQDIAGGSHPTMDYHGTPLTGPDSNDTNRSPRKAKAEPTERQNMVRGAELCYNRGGTFRGPSKSPSSQRFLQEFY